MNHILRKEIDGDESEGFKILDKSKDKSILFVLIGLTYCVSYPKESNKNRPKLRFSMLTPNNVVYAPLMFWSIRLSSNSQNLLIWWDKGFQLGETVRAHFCSYYFTILYYILCDIKFTSLVYYSICMIYKQKCI